MRKSAFQSDQKAQQSLEFSIIIALVLAAIVIMAPYVIRSWNAHVKSLDDSVSDSFHDPLLDEPDPHLNPIPCECGDLEPTNQCGPPHCDEKSRYFERKCDEAFNCVIPSDIQMSYCMEDATCCVWTVTGICGANVPATQGGPCPDGTSQVKGDCGFGHVEYRCSNDPELANEISSQQQEQIRQDCTFECGIDADGNRQSPGTDPESYNLCGQDTGTDIEDQKGLTSDLPWTYVEAGGCTSETKCEVECCDKFCPVNSSPVPQ